MHRLVVASAILSLCPAALAQTNIGAVLTAGNDVFSYAAPVSSGVSGAPASLPTTSTTGGAVALNFNVDTGANPPPRDRHLTAGNWFYRVSGDSRERHLANASGRTLTGSSQVDYDFNQVFGAAGAQLTDLSAKMGFQLTDTGPNSSLVTTYLCFSNSSSVNSYLIDTFLAVDFSLGGTQANDTGLGLSASSGRRLDFTDGGTNGVLFGPGAIGSATGANAAVLGKLTDAAGPDNFPDLNAGGLPTGDLQGLVQYETVVPPGAMVCFPAYIGVGINDTMPDVPAPSAAAAIVALGLLSRRRGRAS